VSGAVEIDPKIFTELRAMVGEDFIDKLVDTFFEETDQLIETLRQALARDDPASFQRAAHSIKSSSASLGALQFSSRARELEMIGKQGQLGVAQEQVEDLVAEYHLVRQALFDLSQEVRK
jgi:HPt (histidine-containing phosphotransfer) domain-containing protein